MNNSNFTYSFTTSKTPHEIFPLLLDVTQWWSGVFGETIEGKSEKVNDEFTFRAGGGMHYSKQKLIELIPDKKVVWEVTDSKLTFLQDTSEWNGSTISFDIIPQNDNAKIIFTHEGLVPQLECYNNCSNGWMQYLAKLQQKLSVPVGV